MSEDQLSSIEEVIWQAEPHALAGAAARAIERHFAADSVDVLLPDYQMTFLVPVISAGPPIRIDGSTGGRAFAGQQPVLRSAEDGRTEMHLPLTVQGDRRGVLFVALPRVPDTDEQLRLVSVAIVLSRALKIADQSTDLYQRIMRQSRLTLPAEIQWDLLPARACVTDAYNLAGQLEPAYSVWGDNFDWSADPDQLTVSVTNGMGRGTEAALLTHLAISALRNARRSGADIVEQAILANETLHNHHHGKRYVETVLMSFDLDTGRMAVIDAGSPQLFRLRGNVAERLEFDAQMALGMFDDTRYVAEELTIEPGDRLVVVSDGVHTALSPTGVLYGASALAGALRDTRLQGPSEAVRTLTRNLIDYHEGADLLDDAVIVCIDWTGRAAAAGITPGGSRA